MMMTQTIQEEYKSIVLKLKSLYSDEEARAIADRLFENYVGLIPTQRILSNSTLIDRIKKSRIDEALIQLLNHKPLQYVLGEAYFMDMVFTVNSSVLIPRPETEEMVHLIIKEYEDKPISPSFTMLDIGSGSGCIPIAIKHHLPAFDVFSIDISEEAIAVAKANAQHNKVEVHFLKADILDQTQWESLPQCDLIVSNPPYVTHAEKRQMRRNVLEYEPHTALFVPDSDPLMFYRAIIEFSKTKLNNKGRLWFEVNEQFCEELKDIALNQGFKDVNIIFDFRGKSRFLHCIK